jgi:hypothetical protein
LSSPVVHAQQITPDYIVNASEPTDGKHRFQRLQDVINQIVTDDLAHRLPASRRITVLVEPESMMDWYISLKHPSLSA